MVATDYFGPQRGFSFKALVRGVMARNRLRNQALAALCIQAYWRGYVQRKKYRRLRDQVTHMQAHARGILFRRKSFICLQCSF
jgi:hypothetical protein